MDVKLLLPHSGTYVLMRLNIRDETFEQRVIRRFGSCLVGTSVNSLERGPSASYLSPGARSNKLYVYELGRIWSSFFGGRTICTQARRFDPPACV